MAAYRRVTVPRFLFAVTQLAAAAVGIALCLSTSTDKWTDMAFGFHNHKGGSGLKHYYRGYPVPWLEQKQKWTVEGWALPNGGCIYREEDPELIGLNPAVPVALLILAACGPVVTVRLFGSVLVRDRRPASWFVRLQATLVMAAAVGLLVAFLDILTCRGLPIRPVPFCQSPADRFADDPRVRDSVKWLMAQRDALRLVEISAFRSDDLFRPEDSTNLFTGTNPESPWPLRTRRTLYGFALGAVFGCIGFRPWRRPPPPAG